MITRENPKYNILNYLIKTIKIVQNVLLSLDNNASEFSL